MSKFILALALLGCRENAASEFAHMLAGELGSVAACKELDGYGYGDVAVCWVYPDTQYSTRDMWFCTSDPYECYLIGKKIHLQMLP